jgi:CHAD domain-containing protein
MPPNQAAAPPTPLRFTSRQRANTALRRALLDLAEHWAAHGEAVRSDPDPELLHQLRVSLRRSRSLLREMRSVLDPTTIAVYGKEFKWISGWTGPVRDLDVLADRMVGYARRLGDPERQASTIVRRALVARRRVAREQLLAALESERYQRFTEGWSRFLTTAPATLGPLGRATLPRAVTPALERLLARLARRRRRLGSTASDEMFHRARIDAKRLRYLLETFSALYPEPATGTLLRELHKLQGILGEFNDCRVHAHLLEAEASGIPGREPGRGAAVRAVRAIRQRLDKKAVRNRQRAVRRLAKIEAAGEGLFS